MENNTEEIVGDSTEEMESSDVRITHEGPITPQVKGWEIMLEKEGFRIRSHKPTETNVIEHMHTEPSKWWSLVKPDGQCYKCSATAPSVMKDLLQFMEM